jgi:hypothetical protein
MSADKNIPRPVLVVMRSATSPSLADSVYGFRCHCCGQALAASPTGAAMMEKPGAIAFCNSCGAAVIGEIVPKVGIAQVGVTPRAVGQADRLGLDIEGQDPKRKTIDEFYDAAQAARDGEDKA